MQIKKSLRMLLCLAMCIGVLAGCAKETPSNTDTGETPQISESTTEQLRESTTQQQETEPQIVFLSDPIDIALWQEETRSDIMDLSYYLSDMLSVSELKTSGDCCVRSYKWSEENFSVLEDYVALLCTEYDFAQAGDPYYEDYGNVKFFDFTLRYIGDQFTLEGIQSGPFSEVSCDVTIEGKVERGSVDGRIWYDGTLTAGDDGYRHNQTERVCTQAGASAGAGLEYCGGTYYTTDGRLSTTLGHAAILTDGKTEQYTARYEINLDQSRFYVHVEDEYQVIRQQIYVPILEDWQDGFYPASYFVKEESFSIKSGGVEDRVPKYTWPTQFTAVHDSKYVYPIQALSGEMTGFGFRVMYRDDQTIVLYTCAVFRSEPTVVEALIAVSTDVEPVSDGETDASDSTGSRRCSTCGGDGKCNRCGGSGSVTEWEGTTFCKSCIGSGKCPYCNGSGK